MKHDLIYWNSIGLIPGPQENEEDFFARVQSCLCLKEKLMKLGNKKLPRINSGEIVDEILKESFAITRQLYGIAPNWIPVAFSNWKMAPWHGGCTWIFQEDENSPPNCLLQARNHFLKHKKYLSIYQRDELIAHECAHIGRMAYTEEKFEELLAYRSNKSICSRLLGGILSSGIEAAIIMFLLLLIFWGDIFQLIYNLEAWSGFFLFMKFLVGLLIMYGIGRVIYRKNQLNKCIDVVMKITKDVDKANAVVYRLSDNEIILFGKISQNKILDYIEREKQHSLRWRVIAEAYLKPNMLS